MLTRLFPPRIDNSFPGIRLGLWLFVPHLALRLLQGINSIVMTERVMVGADGIPLATYPPEAAATAISLFALLGADRLVIGAIGLVALGCSSATCSSTRRRCRSTRVGTSWAYPGGHTADEYTAYFRRVLDDRR